MYAWKGNKYDWGGGVLGMCYTWKSYIWLFIILMLKIVFYITLGLKSIKQKPCHRNRSGVPEQMYKLFILSQHGWPNAKLMIELKPKNKMLLFLTTEEFWKKGKKENKSISVVSSTLKKCCQLKQLQGIDRLMGSVVRETATAPICHILV